jgi:hypothetical protein
MTNVVRVVGLAVLIGVLAGCTGLTKEQEEQAYKEIAACRDKGTSTVEVIHCKWIVIDSYTGSLNPYDQLAYAQELKLAGMVDRGEITLEQAEAAYKEYYAQVQLALMRDNFARQQEVNRVVMSGLNSMDQPNPNRATCTSTRSPLGNSVTTQCY